MASPCNLQENKFCKKDLVIKKYQELIRHSNYEKDILVLIVLNNECTQHSSIYLLKTLNIHIDFPLIKKGGIMKPFIIIEW